MAIPKYPGKNKATFTTGAIKDADGNAIDTLQEAQKISSQCGCGPDCCNNVYHWLDQETGAHYVEYVSGGVKVLQLHSAFLTDGPTIA